jgi:flagellar hook-basal body complex protein FliE
MAIDLKAFNPLSALKGMGQSMSSTSAAPTGGVPGGKDFLAMVKDAAQEAIKTGQKAESMSVAGVAGQADLLDVVRAVGNAEVTLQTVVAVRDKMVTAYQELLRMPI